MGQKIYFSIFISTLQLNLGTLQSPSTHLAIHHHLHLHLCLSAERIPPSTQPCCLPRPVFHRSRLLNVVFAAALKCPSLCQATRSTFQVPKSVFAQELNLFSQTHWILTRDIIYLQCITLEGRSGVHIPTPIVKNPLCLGDPFAA